MLPLWPGLAPGSENRDNREHWQDSTKVFEVFQPALYYRSMPGKERKAAVIICPGGGYRQIEMVKEGRKVARWFQQHGIQAFVLKYRLNADEALTDALQAVRLIRSRADQFNITPHQIGMIGFSAGAHLCSQVVARSFQGGAGDALDETVPRPDYWIAVYGRYRSRDASSPQRGLTGCLEKGAPPVLIIHAGDDSKVPALSSVRLYEACLKKGVPAELHVFEQGEHGFALETDRGDAVTRTVAHWSALCLSWLRLHGLARQLE